jgi:xanthine dehydrogenase accessory factor
MQDFFQLLSQLLSGGETVALATIFSGSGSAPRTTGARMAVRQDGSSIGTVGGGQLEATVQQAAAEVLQNGRARVLEFHLDGKDAAQMEMICGGEVSVLVERLEPDAAQLYQQAAAAAKARRPGVWLVAEFYAQTADPGQVRRALVSRLREEEKAYDVLHSPEDRLETPLANLAAVLTRRDPKGEAYPFLASFGDKRVLFEPVSIGGTLVLFGGGHVAQQVAPLAAKVGFRTVIVEDRPEYADRERFPDADDLVSIETFERAVEALDINPDSYLVIVTRGHLFDKTVLAQALRTSATYIGMIGSTRKRDAIYQALREEGYSEQDLARVHCPIGLKIGAETPEEIAVSIVAELIRARAQREQ